MAVHAGAIRAGRAFVELYADSSKLMAGLRAASAKLQAWGTSISAVGASMMRFGSLVLGGFALAGRHFMNAGDALAKMSQRTGMSVESLSALDYAATRSGTSLEALEPSLRRMARSISAAESGTKSSVEALGKLGLIADDLRGKSPEEQFRLLAGRIAAVEDPSERAARALEIFGRSGTALLPMFAEGEKGFQALIDRARRLGIIMSTEQAQAAVVLKNAMDDVWLVLKRVWFEIGAALIPILWKLAFLLLELAKRVRAWVQAHQGAILAAAKLAAGILALGAALWTLGKILIIVGGLFKMITLATKAFAMAQAFGQAMSGPKGYLILAASLAAAAGAAYGVHKAWKYINEEIAKAGDMLKDMPRWEDLMKAMPKISDAREAALAGRAAGAAGAAAVAAAAAVTGWPMPPLVHLRADEAAEMMRLVTRTPTAAGLFNALRLSTLGGGLTATDKIVEHTRRTAENTGDILDELQDPEAGATFE